jgi:hypothetical protein
MNRAGRRNQHAIEGRRRWRLNGVEPPPDGPPWEALTMAVAAGRLDRPHATAGLRTILAGKRQHAG